MPQRKKPGISEREINKFKINSVEFSKTRKICFKLYKNTLIKFYIFFLYLTKSIGINPSMHWLFVYRGKRVNSKEDCWYRDMEWNIRIEQTTDFAFRQKEIELNWLVVHKPVISVPLTSCVMGATHSRGNQLERETPSFSFAEIFSKEI